MANGKYPRYEKGTLIYADRRTAAGRSTLGNFIYDRNRAAYYFLINNEIAAPNFSRAVVNFETDIVGKYFVLSPPPETDITAGFYFDNVENIRPHIGKSFIIENRIGNPAGLNFTRQYVSVDNYVIRGGGSIPDGEARLITLEKINDTNTGGFDGTVTFSSSPAPVLSISEAIQGLSQEGIITLYEFTIPAELSPTGRLHVARFTPNVLAQTTARDPLQRVFFGRNEYVPIPIESDNFKWDGKSEFTRPKIRIGLGNLTIRSLFVGKENDLLGVQVRIMKTFKDFLDDGQYGNVDNPSFYFNEIYFLERKASLNKVYIEYELANAIDHESAKIPKRQAIRNICTHRYRFYDIGTGEKYPGYIEGAITYANRRNAAGRAILGNFIYDTDLRNYVFILNNNTEDAANSRAVVHFETDVVGKWFALGPPSGPPSGSTIGMSFYIDNINSVSPHTNKSFVIENKTGVPTRINLLNTISEDNYIATYRGGVFIPDGGARVFTLAEINNTPTGSYDGSISLALSDPPDGSGKFIYANATCPYMEDKYFLPNGFSTLNGQPDGDPVPPEKDQCGKRLSDCKKRFGEHAVLPIRAFPGMARSAE